MKTAALILLAAVAGTAEVARRDVQAALSLADGGFDYELQAPVGGFAGSDRFDRIESLRLGGRWAVGRPGAATAWLLGADVERVQAPLGAGGLDGWGLGGAAGGTWAAHDRLAGDAELAVTVLRVEFDLPTGGTSLTGPGTMQRLDLRLRGLWHLDRRWSLGVEASYGVWSATIAADDGRDLALDGHGATVGLVLAWRPSARPAGVE